MNENIQTKRKVDVNKSHAMFNTVVIRGDRLTVVELLFSRISGCYMLEPNAKSGGFPYLNEYENEISADTHGLPIWYFKPVVSHEPMQEYYDKFIKLRNAGKFR